MTTGPTDLGDWRPRPDKIRHSYRCARLDPLLDAVRVLDDGRRVPYRVCPSCSGTDLAERLLSQLDPDPTGDAA